MPQDRARQIDGGTRDAGTQSARDALEHPHMLLRFQRDPLAVAMQTAFAPAAGGKSPARQPPKRSPNRG